MKISFHLHVNENYFSYERMGTRPESLKVYPALTNVNYDRNVLVSIVCANHASSKPAPGFALKKTPKVIRKWPIDFLPCPSCDSVLLVTVFSTYVVYASFDIMTF